MSLLLSRSHKALFHGEERFDPWFLAWRKTGKVPADAAPVSAADAARWAFREGGARRVPVGVIGPRHATAAQLAAAHSVGAGLAELGATLVCGGRGGVMEAASKGCWEAGGTTIGMLPDAHWSAANPYVTIPIATGLGEVRNAVIARASLALVAIGGSYGTLTEIAYGLHFGRPVFLLEDAFAVPGALRCDGVEDTLARVARVLIGLPLDAG